MRIGHEYVESKEVRISIEAFLAQRMAELESMSAYRNGKIAKYKEWADPVKRAEIIEKHKELIEDAKKQLKIQFASKTTEDAYRNIAVRQDISPLKISSPYEKPSPVSTKLTWKQRIKKFLCIG